MSQEERAEGSDSVAGTSREMWREVPQKCYQESEIQHCHFCAGGKAIHFWCICFVENAKFFITCKMLSYCFCVFMAFIISFMVQNFFVPAFIL